MALEDIRLSDYHYDLPQERIAQQPLVQRDQSKLLCYHKGKISHQQFNALDKALPTDSLLVFNNTKVIHARLYFRRQTGALIEILLLHPLDPIEVQQVMICTDSCVWQCVVGRKKKWKEAEILKGQFILDGSPVNLSVEWADRSQNHIRFSWKGGLSWAAIIGQMGELPLPPYIDRKATKADEHQYQTVYARHEGAVAAPTAGLHFTSDLLEKLRRKNIAQAQLTLHVSAGTFLPVKEDEVAKHPMHKEQFLVDINTLKQLQTTSRKIFPVGTTAMRVLESLYWLGLQMHAGPDPGSGPLFLGKLVPYKLEHQSRISLNQSLQNLIDYCENKGLNQLIAETEILIMPGYSFQVCHGLITNFHMPGTTLILLVAALVGSDWRNIYEEALSQDYRFLSYGDSSLLIP